MKLVLTIPCLNEAATIGSVITAIPRSIPGVHQIDILVIDDGSTDDTAARAAAAGARVVRNPTNLGLGRTFRVAMLEALAAGADVIVTIDGDGQFDPADIPRLAAPVIAGEAQMVTASRFADPALVPKMPAVKRWGNRQVARIVRLLTGKRFHDVSCGFRALSREAVLQMNLFGGFTYTQETFLDLTFKGVEIVELPVRVRGTREFGRSRMASNLPRYAWRSFRIMLRAFIAYRPFTFFAAIAAVFFAGGGALLGFLLWHYLETGAFSPHIWAGFVGGSLSFVGVITLVIGFLGDMLVRIRMNQERLLYLLKRSRFGQGAGELDEADREALLAETMPLPDDD